MLAHKSFYCKGFLAFDFAPNSADPHGLAMHDGVLAAMPASTRDGPTTTARQRLDLPDRPGLMIFAQTGAQHESSPASTPSQRVCQRSGSRGKVEPLFDVSDAALDRTKAFHSCGSYCFGRRQTLLVGVREVVERFEEPRFGIVHRLQTSSLSALRSALLAGTWPSSIGFSFRSIA
jgi:hypothetical protein